VFRQSARSWPDDTAAHSATAPSGRPIPDCALDGVPPSGLGSSRNRLPRGVGSWFLRSAGDAVPPCGIGSWENHRRHEVGSSHVSSIWFSSQAAAIIASGAPGETRINLLTLCDPLHTRPARMPLCFSSNGAVMQPRSPWEGSDHAKRDADALDRTSRVTPGARGRPV
jgi:hypothetical protein